LHYFSSFRNTTVPTLQQKTIYLVELSFSFSADFAGLRPQKDIPTVYGMGTKNSSRSVLE
jgi:hypothetical protein